MLGGVAAGIAEFVNVAAAPVRVLFVIVTLLTLGIGALVYLLLWLLLPASDKPAGPDGSTG